MSARTRRRPADESGFTLVELLVVMLILGVLAAIGIASFLNQRSKAQDSEAKVDAVTAAKALTVWHTDHETFAGATPDDLIEIEPSLKRTPGLALSDLSTDTFTVSVDSPAGSAGGGTFTFKRLSSGDDKRDCGNPGQGSCLATADAQGNRW
jgi:type IV pilus assembly protein PilA